MHVLRKCETIHELFNVKDERKGSIFDSDFNNTLGDKIKKLLNNGFKFFHGNPSLLVSTLSHRVLIVNLFRQICISFYERRN